MLKNLNFIRALLIVPAIILLISSAEAQVATVPSGFVVQQIATFDKPVSMSFLPDNRILLAREDGYMYVFKNGSLINTPALTIDSIYWGNEKGFLGIVADPNFSSNGYIYCYYTIDVRGNKWNNITLNVQGGNPPIRHKVARYTMVGDMVLAGSKKTILDMDITSGALMNVNHDGGTMHFGPDGKLYLVTGEGDLWCPCFLPSSTSCDWSCSSCQGLGPSGCVTYQWADNYNSFFGKILRMNPDGSAPIDNPYYSSPAPIFGPQKYFYAVGFRNPFTFHFRPGTSDIYVNDVGSHNSGKREEINRVSYNLNKKHFGWPKKGEGSFGDPNYIDPVYTYQEGNTTTTGCAITGGTFFSPANTNWPSQYKDKYYYMDFCNGWINSIDFDNSNTISGFATGLANNFGNANSGIGSLFLEVGNDGQMYYLARSTNSSKTGMYRLSYQPDQVSSVNTITSPASIINSCGGTLQMQSGVSPSNSSLNTITWDVAPAGVASINSTGLLTALDNGVVTVTAYATGDYTKFQTKLITISNQVAPTSLSITAASITTDKGSVQLNHTILPANVCNNAVTWSVISSTGSALATISGSGQLTSLGNNGTVTVAARSVIKQSIVGTAVISITGQMIQVDQLVLMTDEGVFRITSKNGILTLRPEISPSTATNTEVMYTLTTITGNASLNTVSGILTAISNGIVEVRAISISNPTVTSTISVTITGQNGTTTSTINSSLTNKDIIIYPNPNPGIFNIYSSSQLGSVLIEVVTPAANIVYQEKVNNFVGVKQMNLSHLPKGIYRISIITSKGAEHKMVLIE